MRYAVKIGLGINAGHDLNLDNLAAFIAIGAVAEVSIGHALIADSLEFGLSAAGRKYLDAIAGATNGGAACGVFGVQVRFTVGEAKPYAPIAFFIPPFPLSREWRASWSPLVRAGDRLRGSGGMTGPDQEPSGPNMPWCTMKSTTCSTPCPLVRSVNTKGRSPRCARASRSITSREAPT